MALVPLQRGLCLASGNWRLPDASVVRKERFPDGRVTVNMAGFAPDVAFQILSPSNTRATFSGSARIIRIAASSRSGSTRTTLGGGDVPDCTSYYFQEGQTLVIETLSQCSLDLNCLFST